MRAVMIVVVVMTGGIARADLTEEGRKRAVDAFERTVFEAAEDALTEHLKVKPDYFAGHRLVKRSGQWGAVYIVPRSNDDSVIAVAKCVFVRVPTEKDRNPKIVFQDLEHGIVGERDGIATCPINVDDATAKRLARRAGMPWK